MSARFGLRGLGRVSVWGVARGPVVALAVVLVLTACSRSDDNGDAATMTGPIANTSTSAPGGPVPTSAPSSVPATTRAGGERCNGSGVRIQATEGRAATGHALAVVEIVNTSAGRCAVNGYPSVDVLDGQGRVLAQATSRSGFILNDRPPTAVTIEPGGVAYFGIESTSVCGGGGPGTIGERLRIVLPDDSQAITMAAPLTVCPQPDIRVSPVRESVVAISQS